MSTLKSEGPVATDDDARASAPSANDDGAASKSAEIKSFELDPATFDSGDPYNQTGTFLVEHLRRLEKGDQTG